MKMAFRPEMRFANRLKRSWGLGTGTYWKIGMVVMVLTLGACVSCNRGISNPANPVPPTSTPTAINTAATATITPLAVYVNGTFTSQSSGVTYLADNNNSNSDESSIIYPASTAYGGDTESVEFVVSNLNTGGYSGFGIGTHTVAPVNLSGYTLCTFYAKASESITAQFNGAIPAGDNLSVLEPVNTSWSYYTISIADGSRSDSFANSNSPTTSIAESILFFFAEVTGVGSNYPSLPVTVYVDRVILE